MIKSCAILPGMWVISSSSIPTATLFILSFSWYLGRQIDPCVQVAFVLLNNGRKVSRVVMPAVWLHQREAVKCFLVGKDGRKLFLIRKEKIMFRGC